MTTKAPVLPQQTAEQISSSFPIEMSNVLPLLWTPEQTGAHIGVKTSTLAAWRHYHSRKKRRSGGKPIPKLKFVTIGRLIRYRPEDVQAFIESQVTETVPPQKPQKASPGRPRLRKAS